MAHSYDARPLLDRAFEYYVTGRFAALNTLRVGPNLLHHAIEMLAKFELLRRVPDDRLAEEVESAKNRYRHDLQKLWPAYKDAVKDPTLSRFNRVISKLHRWEELRYGGFPRGRSTTMSFMPRRGPHRSWANERTDDYVLVLEDVDELFTAMVAASGINPRFLVDKYWLRDDLREWYAKDNQHPMPGVLEIEP
jgi:hypothetical protein